MTVEDMRRHINEYYAGKWTAIHQMPGRQIMAIYYTMKKAGKFDKPAPFISKPKKVTEDTVVNTQLSIFEMPEYQRSLGMTDTNV